MKFILKNGGEIEVINKSGEYLIFPSHYQSELDYFLSVPEIIVGGTYPTRTNTDLGVRTIIETYMFNRQVEKFIGDIGEIPNEPGVIY